MPAPDGAVANLPRLPMTHPVPDSTTREATSGYLVSNAAAGDSKPPAIVSWPAHATPIDAILRIGFNEPIQFGTGTLELWSDGRLVRSEVLGTSPHVTLSGNILSYRPPEPLKYATTYVLRFNGLALKDLAGNSADLWEAPVTFQTGRSQVPVQFTGTDQSEVVDGSDLADHMSGGAGTDKLRGWGGDDILHGGDERAWFGGGDELHGGDGNDHLHGGEGDDLLWGGNGDDRLFGGDDDDILLGEAGDDELDGGAGDDGMKDTGGINTLLGGAGNDHLTFEDGATGLLDGGDGNDTLSGDSGEFRGGAGDDRITILLGGTPGQVSASGGIGSDTFVLRLLSGPGAGEHAILTDFTPGEGGDLIDVDGLLGSGWSGTRPFVEGPLRLVAAGPDTLLQVVPGYGAAFTTVLQIKGVLPEQLGRSNIVGGYDPQGGTAGATLRGTPGDDNLEGTRLDDTLQGLGGDDRLNGGDGDDTLEGGDGNDTLSDSFGNNRLLGGGGNDQLSTSSGPWRGSTAANVLDGGDGDDWLSSSEQGATLLGGAGKDRLQVLWTYYDGPAPIVLSGGDGDDDLDIQPTHIRSAGKPVTVTVSGGRGADTFRLDDIAPGLTITDFGSEDRLDLSDLHILPWKPGNPFGALGYLSARAEGGGTAIYVDLDGAAGNEHRMTLAFTLAGIAPGALSASNFVGNYSPDGSGKGLVLAGSDGRDSLTGTDMDDTISGGGGIDAISGGAGNDTIDGGDEDGEGIVSGDAISGGDGDDVIHGGRGGDRIDGGSGNDQLHGDAGHDNLNGSSGDDKLYGGDGNDLLFDGHGANLLDGGPGDDSIQTGVRGTQGTVAEGGDGNDSFEIGPMASQVNGGAGEDNILLQLGSIDRSDSAMLVDAGAGDDRIVISGDARAVTVSGGAGSDHYRFDNVMPQLVTITDFQAGAGGDVFELYSMLPNAADGNPLAPGGSMRLVQDGSRVLLQHDADGQAGPLDFATRIVFEQSTLAAFTAANFTEGLRPDGSAGGWELRGTAAADELRGDRLDDLLYGGDGNDTLYGGRGKDVLHGDSGRDLLSGDSGDDLLQGGGGNDALIGGSGNDRLVGGEGVDTALFTGRRTDFTVTRTAGGFQVADRSNIQGEGTDTLEGIERLSFSDNSTLALDIDGAAGQAYRLYRAAFDRTPDGGGIGFWIRALDAGTSLLDIATGFTQSTEFRDLYGAAPGNAELVGRLYQNILHRAPEQGGFDYWVRALDSKAVTLPEVLAMFSESAENQAAVAELIAGGIVYFPY